MPARLGALRTSAPLPQELPLLPARSSGSWRGRRRMKGLNCAAGRTVRGGRASSGHGRGGCCRRRRRHGRRGDTRACALVSLRGSTRAGCQEHPCMAGLATDTRARSAEQAIRSGSLQPSEVGGWCERSRTAHGAHAILRINAPGAGGTRRSPRGRAQARLEQRAPVRWTAHEESRARRSRPSRTLTVPLSWSSMSFRSFSELSVIRSPSESW